MNWYRTSQESKVDLSKIVFDNQHVDYHSGQHDYNLIANIDSQPVGLIEYTDYQDDIYINHILVHHALRRQGIGTKMSNELKRLYPSNKINWGMMTDDGAALNKSLDNQ
jgi:GNAT superfamily N-acetyltransferase